MNKLLMLLCALAAGVAIAEQAVTHEPLSVMCVGRAFAVQMESMLGMLSSTPVVSSHRPVVFRVVLKNSPELVHRCVTLGTPHFGQASASFRATSRSPVN